MRHLLNLFVSFVISIFLFYLILPHLASDSVGGMMSIIIFLPWILIVIIIFYIIVHLVATKLLHKNINFFYLSVLLGILSPFLTVGTIILFSELRISYWKRSYQKEVPTIIGNYKLSNFRHRLVCLNDIVVDSNCSGIEISYELTVKKPGTYIMGFTKAKSESRYYYYKPIESGYLTINFDENGTNHVKTLLVPNEGYGAFKRFTQVELEEDVMSKGNFKLETIWLRDDKNEPLKVNIQYGDHANSGGDEWGNTPELYYNNLEFPPYNPSLFYLEYFK